MALWGVSSTPHRALVRKLLESRRCWLPVRACCWTPKLGLRGQLSSCQEKHFPLYSGPFISPQGVVLLFPKAETHTSSLTRWEQDLERSNHRRFTQHMRHPSSMDSWELVQQRKTRAGIWRISGKNLITCLVSVHSNLVFKKPCLPTQFPLTRMSKLRVLSHAIEIWGFKIIRCLFFFLREHSH